MIWQIKGEKLTLLWQKYRFVLLILLAGLLLMLLPGGTGDTEKDIDTLQAGFSLEDTERRMEDILSRIEGTGRLQLMLTLKAGSQLHLAEDTDQTVTQDEMQTQKETVTLNRGSGQQDVVVTQEVYPLYQGALVVCQGADQAAVRLAVTEAVSALTGLSSDKIKVVKWNS
ncbi:MAG: stage III sporulation protein AG [Ruminococcaceae bacterium]|nr:stage III sporulation protein AG [Oscillospiraceae bacterium]